PPKKGVRSELWADQLELPDIDGVRAKAAFTVGEIHLPHAPEAIVEAETLNRRPGREEPVAPLGQSRSVAVPEHHRVLDAQLSAIELGFESLDRWQHAAGKDVALDEVGALSIVIEPLLRDGDDLQRRCAAPSEPLTNGIEIAGP